MDIESSAEEIIHGALKKGCDHAEVFVIRTRSFSAEAQGGSVEALQSSRDFGLSLRVLKDLRLGFAFTTDLNGREEVLQEALSAAEWTERDEHLEIPASQPVAPVQVLDEGLKKISEDEIIEQALSLERQTLDSDRRIKKVRKAEVGLAMGSTGIFNSRGLRVSYESGYLSAHITAIAEDGGDSQMGWDYAITRRAGDMDVGRLAQGASKRATELLGARRISTVRAPVILDSSVAVDFLRIFSASLSAEAVQKNRSFLAGREGKEVGSPLITIVDDGLMPWGMGTQPVDDEGVPVLTKTILSEGRLIGFLHNTATANRQGVASTGNAARPSFKGPPGISVTNLFLKPPQGRNDGGAPLFSSLPRGIVVLEAMGVHTANRISGDFSIGISGLWVEEGEVQYPIQEAIITGNILDLLKRVEAVGNDLRFYGKIGSPSLLIGEMDISA